MKPSSKTTVLITRAKTQADSLTSKIKEIGLHPLILPTIEIVKLPVKQREVQIIDDCFSGKYQWIIFLSSNAVEIFKETTIKQGIQISLPTGIKIAAQGAKTSQKISEHFNRIADITPSIYTADELAKTIKPVLSQDAKILIISALGGRRILQDQISQTGCKMDELHLYKAALPNDTENSLAALKSTPPSELIITFFSPSAVRGFVEILDGSIDILEKATVISIGPVTTKTLQDIGILTVIESVEQTEESIIRSITEIIDRG